MFTCPVCGYDHLEYPPADYNICPVCATEFRYHDAYLSHADLRQRWLQKGAPWWDTETPKPRHWDPIAQLRNIGYAATPDDLAAVERNRLPVHFTMEFSLTPADAAEVELMKHLVAA